MKFNLAKHIELDMFFLRMMFLLAGGMGAAQEGFQDEVDNHLLM